MTKLGTLAKLSKLSLALVATSALISVGSAADASIVITFTQQGTDVVASGSGTANLAGLLASFSGNDAFSLLSGANANAILGATTRAPYGSTFYQGVTGPAAFGSGGYFYASSGSGNNFGVDMANSGGRLWVPGAYISGSALSATDTWSGASFASLGLTPGIYNYSWGSGENADTLQVRIGELSGAVPEPATWAMMLLGFATIGWSLRQRSRSLSKA